MGPRRWRTTYYKSRSYADDLFDVPGSSSELDLRERWFVASHYFPPRDAVADHVSTLLFGCCSFPAVVVHQGHASSGERRASELQSHSHLVCRLLLEKKQQTE